MSVRDTYIQFAVEDGADSIGVDRSPDTVPAPPQDSSRAGHATVRVLPGARSAYP
jgi:hypothetical protein